MNEHQQMRFVSNMVSSMFNTVAGKRIALFGAAFKANTSDTREIARPGGLPGLIGGTRGYRSDRSARPR